MTVDPNESSSNDLRQFFLTIWNEKSTVVITTIVFIVLSLFVALSIPNIYKSQVLLAPADTANGDSGLAALAGQFGGLASIAGIDLSAGSSEKSKLAIEVIKSRKFISQFIERHDLLVDLMASDGWSYNSNTISYDEKIYDVERKVWTRDVEFPKTQKPSEEESFKEFKEILYIGESKDTGLITISVEHVSPNVAYQWVKWLVEDINMEMKERDVIEATKSKEFLEEQIENTSIADIREVLFKLIEEQVKTIMFSEIRDEYVFKTIDPPYVPEEKVSPKRALICVVGALFGVLIGILIVLGKNYFREQESPR